MINITKEITGTFFFIFGEFKNKATVRLMSYLKVFCHIASNTCRRLFSLFKTLTHYQLLASSGITIKSFSALYT
jgi:ATP/ADP translocase